MARLANVALEGELTSALMSQFKNLGFVGGGVEAIVYAAALEALEAQNILPDTWRSAGK